MMRFFLDTLYDMCIMIQGVPKKTHHKVLCSFCLLCPATISLESCDISQMKGDIHRYVLSPSCSLCDIGEPIWRQNNTGYQIVTDSILTKLYG